METGKDSDIERRVKFKADLIIGAKNTNVDTACGRCGRP